MPPTAPPAAGVRTPWEDLPSHVHAAVAGILGAPVVHATTQPGGFSPGTAARLRTSRGHRAFVKAVSAQVNAASQVFHRREARHTAALPSAVPAPRLLGSHDDGIWTVLVLEDIEGRQPRIPWRRPELTRVLGAVTDLAHALTPSPVPDAPLAADALADQFDGWQRLLAEPAPAGLTPDALGPWSMAHLPRLAELAAPWPDAVAGDTLAHGDLRADNMLLTDDDRVVFVDWPHIVRGAPWLDLLLMLPCVRAQGGPDPEELFAAHPLGRAADPDAVTAALAGLAGYFVHRSLQPPPPGIPTVRAFQRAQGEAALEWLRKRL
ncbi:aminoglycoside phosphotransferase [Streptomyces sp. Act143]|uniref:phosphotransferase family protein n=1 Tax=Streptomyces sp. Act143 TaxID=2200760 RepID=UPI000D682493|nr:phosphotransferase [Streptomyces sp. Act143]PWI19646.1 aminoglycoside phosphotransferase [Streptomyces sp. Act143]